MDQSALPTMCRGGCGFYGSSATDGFCSKCFKDTLKRKQDTGMISPSSMTPKAVDVSSSRDRILATAMESRVTTNQAASCSGISGASITQQVIEKSEEVIKDQAAAATVEENPAESAPSPSPQKQKNRCDSCRKRVGLTGFECRCGGMFCAVHRYSDMHECSFDYKALGEQEIRKNNPVVKTEKVVKL